MSLIILLTMAIFNIWPKALSGKTRYIIWIVIIVGLIVPFRPLWGNGLFKIEDSFLDNQYINMPLTEDEVDLTVETSQKIDAIDNKAVTHSKSESSSTSVDLHNTSKDAVNKETLSKTPVSNPITNSGTETQKTFNFGFQITIASLLLIIWMLGAIISFSHHLFKYYQFKKLIRRWGVPITDLPTLELLEIVKDGMDLQRKKIRLVRCSSVTTPMLTGFFKPTILLPNKKIEDDELELIFEHELTHYKHRDLYINLLGTLAICLHWFNPIVYFCYPSIQGDCEVCCDESVLSNRDLDYRRFYGEVIISMIEKNSTQHVAFTTCFYARKLNIKRRIFAIMETTKRKKILSFAVMGLILSLILISGSIVVFAGNGNRITAEHAKYIALTDAGLQAHQVYFVKVKPDMEDGYEVYEVKFYKDNAKYDYEIDARSGAIREKDYKVKRAYKPYYNNNYYTAQISLEQAKGIALTDAGLQAHQVTFTKTKADREKGIPVYDVEFYYGYTKYDYEVDAVNGAIREKEVEVKNQPKKPNPQTPAPAPNNPNQNTTQISLDQAKSIALNHAGLSANQVRFTKAKPDTEKGIPVFEIEFRLGYTEYDYEIDARNGRIIDFSQEIDD